MQQPTRGEPPLVRRCLVPGLLHHRSGVCPSLRQAPGRGGHLVGGGYADASAPRHSEAHPPSFRSPPVIPSEARNLSRHRRITVHLRRVSSRGMRLSSMEDKRSLASLGMTERWGCAWDHSEASPSVIPSEARNLSRRAVSDQPSAVRQWDPARSGSPGNPIRASLHPEA